MEESNFHFERVKRIINCMAKQNMTIDQVMKRMDWRLLHIDIDAKFDYTQEKGSALAQEDCDQPGPRALAKRKVLHHDHVAFAKTVTAVKDRTFACLDRIKDWKLKPDTSKFPWSKYIKHAGDDTDGADGEDGDDNKPLPPATKRTNKTAATKTTSKVKAQAKTSKGKGKGKGQEVSEKIVVDSDADKDDDGR